MSYTTGVIFDYTTWITKWTVSIQETEVMVDVSLVTVVYLSLKLRPSIYFGKFGYDVCKCVNVGLDFLLNL